MLKSTGVLCLVATVGLGMLTVGCNKKKSGWVKKAEAFRSKACSCKDQACVEEAQKLQAALGPAKPETHEASKFAKALNEGQACITAVLTKGLVGAKPAGGMAAAKVDWMKKAEAYKAKACSCKNRKCAQQAQQLHKEFKTGQVSRAEHPAFIAIIGQGVKCIQKLHALKTGGMK